MTVLARRGFIGRLAGVLASVPFLGRGLSRAEAGPATERVGITHRFAMSKSECPVEVIITNEYTEFRQLRGIPDGTEWARRYWHYREPQEMASTKFFDQAMAKRG